jgi:hypothetical protein
MWTFVSLLAFLSFSLLFVFNSLSCSFSVDLLAMNAVTYQRLLCYALFSIFSYP